MTLRRFLGAVAALFAIAAAWYESQGSRLYVSRGLGTSIVAARFFCRPEVTLFTLRPPAP